MRSMCNGSILIDTIEMKFSPVVCMYRVTDRSYRVLKWKKRRENGAKLENISFTIISRKLGNRSSENWEMKEIMHHLSTCCNSPLYVEKLLRVECSFRGGNQRKCKSWKRTQPEIRANTHPARAFAAHFPPIRNWVLWSRNFQFRIPLVSSC